MPRRPLKAPEGAQGRPSMGALPIECEVVAIGEAGLIDNGAGEGFDGGKRVGAVVAAAVTTLQIQNSW